MTITEAQELLANVSDDDRMDLLMFLAEQFDFSVFRGGEDITYFLSTGDGLLPDWYPRPDV